MTLLLESLKIGAREKRRQQHRGALEELRTTHGNRYIGRFKQRSLFKRKKRDKRRDVSPTGLHQAKDLKRLTEDGVTKTEKRSEK